MAIRELESGEGVAGGYAQERYEAGLKSWHRALWMPFLLTSAPMMLFGVVVYAFNTDAWLPWFAGAFFGIGVSLVVFFRDEPPAYLRHWRDGAEGERLTGAELDRLDGSTWRVLHDVQLPGRRANLDHVAIGPAGVFVLETKHWQGYVDVDERGPVLKRRHDPEADKPLRPIGQTTVARAVELRQHLIGQGLVVPWVQAVVVPWADFDAQVTSCGHCAFVAGPALQTWLISQPHTDRAVDVDALAAAVPGTPFPKSFPKNDANWPQAPAYSQISAPTVDT